MYEFEFGPIRYNCHKDGRPITLVDAIRAVYGVGQARILRSDGTVIVNNAGSSVQVTHLPSGRMVRANHH